MSKTAADFKVKVEVQPAVVDGRLLPAPVLEYRSPSHYYAGSVGAWNMVEVRYFPVRLDKFSLHPKRDRGNPQSTTMHCIQTFALFQTLLYYCIALKAPAIWSAFAPLST